MGCLKSKPKETSQPQQNPVQNSDTTSQTFKFLIVGEPGVGKTSLLLRFVDNTFSENSIGNIGEDHKTKEIDVDGHRITIQIYDTAGQEKFRKITFGLYRNAQGIALAYDISQESTFKSLDRWLTDIVQYGGESIPKIVVGNKTDLESQRAVPKANAEQWAADKKLEYIETSAKTGNNVSEMFVLLAKQCLQKNMNE